MKQETLQEAAEYYVWGGIYLNEPEKQQTEIAFIAGAKWQAERMYSEEEVEKIAKDAYAMTQFKRMAIKVANEFQFNQVADKLRGMGYIADADPPFSEWHHDVFECNFYYHILTYKDGEFSISPHKGGDYRIYFTYEQFMQIYDASDLVATTPLQP